MITHISFNTGVLLFFDLEVDEGWGEEKKNEVRMNDLSLQVLYRKL